jgi:hypothetical protein
VGAGEPLDDKVNGLVFDSGAGFCASVAGGRLPHQTPAATTTSTAAAIPAAFELIANLLIGSALTCDAIFQSLPPEATFLVRGRNTGKRRKLRRRRRARDGVGGNIAANRLKSVTQKSQAAH